MLKNQSFMNELNKLETDKELDHKLIRASDAVRFDMTFFKLSLDLLLNLQNPHIKPYEQFFMEMEVFPIQEVGPGIDGNAECEHDDKKHQMNQNGHEEIFTVETYSYLAVKKLVSFY